MYKFLEEFKTHAKAIVLGLHKELGSVRTNRPTPALVEDLKVNYFDQLTPLKQLASINIIPPREINIQVWDKSAVNNVIKAIETSSLGLSATADGASIRVHLPELSQERREELIKFIKKIAEEHRIRLRHLRDETNKEILKLFEDDELNEDVKFKSKEEVQKETERINKDIENLLENKIHEINS